MEAEVPVHMPVDVHPDLSTFAGRWAEALGGPASAEAKDFKTLGGSVIVEDIMEGASAQCRLLTGNYTDTDTTTSQPDNEDQEVQKRPATVTTVPPPVATAPDATVAAPAFAAASVDDEGWLSSDDEDRSFVEDEDYELLIAGFPSDDSDENSMKFLDLLGGGERTKFLSLNRQGQYLLIRPCYKALYETIVAAWSGPMNRVRVTGNPGTGKSWFQLYALRRLLQGYGESHEYIFVIRQVGNTFYLIDLSDGQVRNLIVVWNSATDILDQFNAYRVLYFFEPLNDRSLLPLPLVCGSLTTLSPFEERTHEYDKNLLTELIFPCWTFEHLATSAENDPKIRKRLEREHVAARFHRFGGIIRHVFANDTRKVRKTQKEKIKDANLNVLCAQTTGIDSDPKVAGNNVSGYLLSYCNIPTVGRTRFASSELDFTSDYVADNIRKKMNDYDIPQRIELVLQHLDGQLTDRGGLHLQEVVSFLLAQGREVQWGFKQVTDPPNSDNRWLPFQTRVREVVKNYNIDQLLGAPNKVLVSLNPNFPFADIVFSCGNVEAKQATTGHPKKKKKKTKTNATPNNIAAKVIDSFQVTWQLYHPFTVRTLYMLRVNYLKIQDKVKIRVFFVAAHKETQYAARSRSSFLKGSIDEELKYSSHTKVPPHRLQLMWQNTEIYVLKPNSSWQDTLRPFRAHVSDHS